MAARNELCAEPAIKRRWPCEQAIRALTYAGWSFEAVKDYLESWNLPAPKSLLRPLYDGMKAEAYEYNPDLVFTQDQLKDNGIKELYNWAISPSDEEPVCGEDSLVVVSTHGILSQQLIDMVCTMLYYMWNEEQIFNELKKSPYRPPRIWNIDQINFYRRFFWDPYAMFEYDWREYRKLRNHAPSMARCFSLMEYGTIDKAFDALGIVIGLTDDTMIDSSIQRLYLLGHEMLKSSIKHQQETGLKYIAQASRMISTKQHASADTGEIMRAIKNIRELQQPAEEVRLTTIGSVQGEVSDYESMRQLRGVVEAEKDQFASYQG